MELNEIPEVSGVKMSAMLKFIVAEVVCGKEKRLVVRADLFVRKSSEDERDLSHDDILNALYEELKDVGKPKMLGGGWLYVGEDRIVIHSDSYEYGIEPDRQATADMLRRAFPERKIEIETS